MILCEDAKKRKEILQNISDDNIVILTSEYLPGKEYLQNNPSKNYVYYFYYDRQIWSMEEDERILELQERLRVSEDYVTAKTYNEFLMLVTYLKKKSTWLHYPKEIQIEHTNKCNARCIMCGHYNADKEKCSDIEADVFGKIEKFLPFCKYVGLHGYGEPFLTNRIEEYFEIYKKYNVKLYTNTNFSHITDNMLPYIAELFDELNISFDSPNKETYETIRKNLSFDKVINNIKRVKKYCPNVKLNLFAVVMRQNIDELEDLVVFAYKMGFSQITLSEMIALPENGNFLDAPGCYPHVLSTNLLKASDKAKELGIRLHFPAEAILIRDNEKENEERKLLNKIKHAKQLEAAELSGVDRNLLFSRKKITEKDIYSNLHNCMGICDVFYSQMYCSLDGKLALCCVDGFHYLCDIKSISTMREYWNTKEVKNVRKAFEMGTLPAVCGNCNFIALNRLKLLKISDRKRYINMINH